MAKDYVKDTLYRKSRAKCGQFWTILGLTISLLLLAIIPFLLTHQSATPVDGHKEKKHFRSSIQSRIALLEPSKPLSPEPKFDFYNVLPNESPTFPDSAPASTVENLQAPKIKGTLSNKEAGQNVGSLGITPEQLAITEAKNS